MIGNFSFSVRLSFWVMLLQSQPRYGGGFQDLVRPPRSGRFQFSHGTSQAQRFSDQSTSGEKRVMRTNRTADPISHVNFRFASFRVWFSLDISRLGWFVGVWFSLDISRPGWFYLGLLLALAFPFALSLLVPPFGSFAPLLGKVWENRSVRFT